MDITCVSDLHGFLPELTGGDLLIIGGDLTLRHSLKEYALFFEWLSYQQYTKKILIAGNHDDLLENRDARELAREISGKGADDFEYLCDSGMEFEGKKIWGSPWSKTFHGINPLCTTFTAGERDLKLNFDKIPLDTEILITHSPPFGIYDQVERKTYDGVSKENVGSTSLRSRILSMPNLKLHIFGHIHNWGGQIFESKTTKFVNASIMDEVYNPIYKPLRVII